MITSTTLPLVCHCQKATSISAYHKIHQPAFVCQVFSPFLPIAMNELSLLLSEANHSTCIRDHVSCHLVQDITPEISPVSPTSSCFPYGLDIEHERKRGVNNHFREFCLNNKWSETSFGWKGSFTWDPDNEAHIKYQS